MGILAFALFNCSNLILAIDFCFHVIFFGRCFQVIVFGITRQKLHQHLRISGKLGAHSSARSADSDIFSMRSLKRDGIFGKVLP